MDNPRTMNVLREEFLIAIRPLSIGLQLLACLLLVVACVVAAPDYHYEKLLLVGFAVMLSITIPMGLNLKRLVPISIINTWTIAGCFLIFIMPSPNRDFWAFSTAIAFALVVAPIYEKTLAYLLSSCGSGLILGAGAVPAPPIPGDMNWVILMIVSVLFLGCVMNFFFSRLHIRNIQLRQELEDLAYRDALTGIGNRRKLIMDIAAASASKDMRDCFFMMIDVDGFKQINDQFGHDQGDEVLRQVGEMLSRLLYADHAGRMGGEEFGVLTLYGGEARARHLAESVLSQAREIRAGGTHPGNRPVTVSIGIAPADATFTEMARNADDALYQAKRSGKDRFVFHRQSADTKLLATVEFIA
jgi:diguanylate cyclase (GGDEF)-like protein